MKYVYELIIKTERGEMKRVMPMSNNLYSSKVKASAELECLRAGQIHHADKLRIKDVGNINEIVDETPYGLKRKYWGYHWTVTFLDNTKMEFSGYITRHTVH